MFELVQKGKKFLPYMTTQKRKKCPFSCRRWLCLLVIGFFTLFSSACSAGFSTSLLEVHSTASSPMFDGNRGVPVIYPYQNRYSRSPLVEAFGPEWQSIRKDYPEYRFN